MRREDEILREMAEVLGSEADAQALFTQLGAAAPVAAASPEAALARFRRRLAAPRWLGPLLVVLCLGTAAVPPLSREGFHAFDHLPWVALTLLSVGLASAATTWPRAVVALAALGALTPGLAPFTAGPMTGAGCGVMELGAALLPLGAAVWGARRSEAVGGWHLAAFAACGASAGNAALAVACPGHADPLQLALVHAAGVWAAGAVGAVLAVPVLRWARGAEA